MVGFPLDGMHEEKDEPNDQKKEYDLGSVEHKACKIGLYCFFILCNHIFGIPELNAQDRFRLFIFDLDPGVVDLFF
jgi:hypothetical protein